MWSYPPFRLHGLGFRRVLLHSIDDLSKPPHLASYRGWACEIKFVDDEFLNLRAVWVNGRGRGPTISKERKLIEAELTKVRRVAEQIHDDCLVYFIDVAIAEAASKSNYRNDESSLREKLLKPF